MEGHPGQGQARGHPLLLARVSLRIPVVQQKRQRAGDAAGSPLAHPVDHIIGFILHVLVQLAAGPGCGGRGRRQG